MRSRAIQRVTAAIVVTSAFSAICFSGSAMAQGEPASRRMRAAECVDLALRNNVDVQTAADDVALSEAQRAQVRGHFGPKIHLDASAHEWNSPYNIPFAIDPTKPPAAFPVRDQFEWNATFTATQPITGLIAIFDAYKVRSLGVDIATIRHEVARRDTAFRVLESYYRLVQGEKLVEVAVASVDQLTTQLKQSNSFHTNGVVSQDDVLRAQLALANAQQRLISVRSRVSLEQARLAVLVGLPADTVIAAQPVAEGAPVAREAATIEQAEKTAETQRIEVVEIDKRIDLAERESKLAYQKLVPEVNAVAAYLHNEGSLFVQTNSGYIGATAAWDIWDWGTTTSGISAAKVRVHQATLARTKVMDQIRLEVRRAFLELTAASEAMVVAQASVASAEENFRLVKKRYDASAATSFDVVDAEGLLTQSRGQMQTALYDQVIARAALRRAMGTAAANIARD